MLKIGDFSQLGQVSVRTLRLYDELDCSNRLALTTSLATATTPSTSCPGSTG